MVRHMFVRVMEKPLDFGRMVFFSEEKIYLDTYLKNLISEKPCSTGGRFVDHAET